MATNIEDKNAYLTLDGVTAYNAIVRSGGQFDPDEKAPAILLSDVKRLLSKGNSEIARLHGVIDGLNMAMNRLMEK